MFCIWSDLFLIMKRKSVRLQRMVKNNYINHKSYYYMPNIIYRYIRSVNAIKNPTIISYFLLDGCQNAITKSPTAKYLTVAEPHSGQPN